MFLLLSFLAVTCFLAVGALKLLITGIFSPLSSFPNAHYSVPFSSFWLLFVKAKNREHRTRLSLHTKLGPVVRIGPRELSVNDANDIKTIYGGGFEKASWYSMFKNYDLFFMFSMIGSKVHAERKRMISHVYSKSYIQTSPELDDIFQTIMKDIVSRVKSWAREGTEIDIYKLTKSFGMDCTSAYLFGLENSTQFVKESMAGGEPLEIFEIGLSQFFWQAGIPRIGRLLTWFGVHLVSDYVSDAWQLVEKLCFNECESAKQSLFRDKNREVHHKSSHPTVYAQLYSKLQPLVDIPEKLDKLMAAEMLDHMIAGNEAPGITLTYLILELSNNLEIRQKLQNEINAFRDSEEPLQMTAKALDALPILDATLQETMRLYPAAFGPFPRVVPPKGARIGNINVPADTVVSISTYAFHRNPIIFPDPEKWRPERWLEADLEAKKEMQRWFWAFGTGGRMCIGNHLAIRMMKTFVMAIFADFETSSIGEKPKQLDGFTGIPKGSTGHKVFIKFHASTKE